MSSFSEIKSTFSPIWHHWDSCASLIIKNEGTCKMSYHALHTSIKILKSWYSLPLKLPSCRIISIHQEGRLVLTLIGCDSILGLGLLLNWNLLKLTILHSLFLCESLSSFNRHCNCLFVYSFAVFCKSTHPNSVDVIQLGWDLAQDRQFFTFSCLYFPVWLFRTNIFLNTFLSREALLFSAPGR